MKKIAVLVDLTESGKPAIKQAKILAESSGAELVVLHVANDNVPDDIHGNIIEAYVKPILGDNIRFTSKIGRGNFLNEIPGMIDSISPDLVVLCTHGIHGIAQNLFGAHVLKLVQSVHFPCLIVQENTTIQPNGMRHILLPASPFADFEMKVKQCAILAELFGAQVSYYEIDKYLGDTQEPISANGKLAEDYMAMKGIPFTSVLEENKIMSLGHAQQTINYAKEHNMDLICLSSKTHKEFMAMGKADKEKFLTNDKGIPILCCG